jgi:hypothetical protein
MLRCFFLLVPGLLVGVVASAPAQTEEIHKGANDLLAFKKHLAKSYPDKKWQSGPSRLDSKEIRAAYPGQKFYFVFSAPPLPPGANLPDVQKAYRLRVEEFRKNFISVACRMDGEGNLKELRRVHDFDEGLKKIQTDEDARIAAAAILSVFGSDRVGPGVVAAKDVTVTSSPKGWSCQGGGRFFQGSVMFSPEGRCVTVSKIYTGPLPP